MSAEDIKPYFIGDETGRRMVWADWVFLMSVARAGIGGELALHAPDGDVVEVAWQRVIEATSLAWPECALRPHKRRDRRSGERWRNPSLRSVLWFHPVRRYR